MKLAFVFPGQGAQHVGMGKDLFDHDTQAAELVQEADETLGYSLSELILNGPEDTLKLTFHTQPALLTVSVAAYRVFRRYFHEDPAFVAGHSLGEYSALVAGGALDFADAVRLVHLRGRWMDEAVPAGAGAMAAVLGMEAAALQAVCAQASSGEDVVELANLNCPGQIVISGTAAAVARASELARERGARRVIPLQVSGPFHCSLMRPAAGKLADELEKTQFQPARVPVVANVDAKAYVDPRDIRRALAEQLYSPVRWEDDVRVMLAAGVDTFVEFGPGGVLSGLIKKIDRSVTTLRVEDNATLAETLRYLGVA